MSIEVELKFKLDEPEAALAALEKLGLKTEAVCDQADCYLAHPVRDFAATDEALRVRTSGDVAVITYKGKKQPGTAKTRREIEVALADGSAHAEQAISIFEALGFRRVAVVRKRRTPGTVQWQGREITVALDDVAQVGRFLELELIAEDRGVKEAEATLLRLADQLGLGQSEPRSYLEMLLATQG